MLEKDKCYMLDCVNEVFVWTGRNTSITERRISISASEVRTLSLSLSLPPPTCWGCSDSYKMDFPKILPSVLAWKFIVLESTFEVVHLYLQKSYCNGSLNLYLNKVYHRCIKLINIWCSPLNVWKMGHSYREEHVCLWMWHCDWQYLQANYWGLFLT